MRIEKSLLTSLLVLFGTNSFFGAGLTPPYLQSFSDYNSLSTMTVVNGEDGSPTWTRYSSSQVPVLFSPAAGYAGDAGFAADDWLVTPALELQAGFVYEFSFTTVGTDDKSNSVDVMIGKGNTVADLSTSLMDKVSVSKREKSEHSVKIKVEETGDYFIGFHVTANADQGYVFLTDIKVNSGLLIGAPSAVTSLSAEAKVSDEKAVMDVKFTLPSSDNGGAALTGITNVLVYRNDVKIDELGEKPVGSEVVYTDEAPLEGNNTYKIVCVNSEGEGEAATVSGNLTYGTPVSPSNIVLSVVDGKQKITWNPVTLPTATEVVFIPSAVTYTVKDKSGITVAENISECSAVDNFVMEGEGQVLLNYTVTANHFGKTSSATSNSILFGNPYTGEFKESFDNWNYTTTTWQTLDRTTSSSSWSIQTSTYFNPAISSDQDGTEGFVAFRNSVSGTSERLVSPIINVSDMQHPRLSLYVYKTSATESDDKVILEILSAGEYTALGDGTGITAKGSSEGWTKYNFDIPAELVKGDFQLSLKGESHGGGYYVAVDNIEIKDALSDNLAVTSVTAPEKVEIGKEISLVATVVNRGVNNASAYKVALSCNGEEVAVADGQALLSDASAEVEFKFVPTPYMAESDLKFTVKAILEGDLNPDDDTAEISVSVITSNLPAPTDLKGNSLKTAVELQWTAPEVPEVTEQPAKTEDFEDWMENTIEGVNGWKFVDVDQSNCYGFPGYGSAMYGKPLAFLVGAKSMSSYASTNSGEKMLVSPKSYSYRDKRDDWAISPEVAGGQTVTFYACNFSSYGYIMYGTNFEFCYSTTDREVSSFTVLETKYDESKEWTKYSFVLPDNARYFAIHVVDGSNSSSDAWMIDDITFQPGSKQLVHTGYNVYRDKKLIAKIDGKENSNYTDTSVEFGIGYTYAVSAIYETGESVLSNEVEVSPSASVSSVSGNSVKIIGGKNQVRFIGCCGKTVNIHNIAGQIVKVVDIESDDTSVELASGLYIVDADGVVSKVIVK